MAPKRTIDLNADVGEASDAAGIETERALLGLVTTAHVACGGHFGDEATMAATVAAALEHSVRIGAHPSYPDADGFGRRPMEIDRDDLGDSLRGQLQSLAKICRAAGTSIESVKPHGALYEEVAKGGAIYETLRDVVRECCGDGIPLVLPSGCRALAMAMRDGVPACEEGFCDRAYRPDGGLVDRATAGAVLGDPGKRPHRRSAWPAVRSWPATAACSRSGWTPSASMETPRTLCPSRRRSAMPWRTRGWT